MKTTWINPFMTGDTLEESGLKIRNQLNSKIVDINYVENFKSNYSRNMLVEDMWYYDGPLLSHVVDYLNNDVLILWIGNSEDTNHWIASILGENEVDKFKSNKVDLRDTMLNARINIFFELDRNIDVLNEREVNVIDFPDYFPESGCYYD